LRKIREHFHGVAKEVGLDVGCGTGNYTLPFIVDYQTLYGLDESEQMLTVARRKPGAESVQWIRANALAPTLPDRSCDAIWSISTLHYFLGEQQKLFFSADVPAAAAARRHICRYGICRTT
jgi:ubiquinone/menaquinone biosynthesis C-methylase UbiE